MASTSYSVPEEDAPNSPPSSDESTCSCPAVLPKQLLIIDTDVSTDSALALLLALTTSDCDVLAITVAKNRWGLEEASENMLRILQVFGKTEIPVYMGQEYRTSDRPRKHPFEDETFICSFPGRLFPPAILEVEDEHAHEVMNRLAEQYRGNVTLVTLGPLTNLGLASRYGRTIRHNLKHLYISGGEKRVLDGDNSHANFYADPLSVINVLEDFSCPMTVVTWEAAEANYVSWEWFKNWVSSGSDASEFIRYCTGHFPDVADLISSRWPGFRSCGLLTMTAMLRPSVVSRSEIRSVTVVPRDPRTRGSLVTRKVAGGSCDFALEFDMDQVRRVWEGVADSVA